MYTPLIREVLLGGRQKKCDDPIWRNWDITQEKIQSPNHDVWIYTYLPPLKLFWTYIFGYKKRFICECSPGTSSPHKICDMFFSIKRDKREFFIKLPFVTHTGWFLLTVHYNVIKETTWYSMSTGVPDTLQKQENRFCMTLTISVVSIVVLF